MKTTHLADRGQRKPFENVYILQDLGILNNYSDNNNILIFLKDFL